MKRTLMLWLWGFAERMDWRRRPPRRFWRWLLHRMDRHHGYYPGYRPMPNPYGPQQGPQQAASDPSIMRGSDEQSIG